MTAAISATGPASPFTPPPSFNKAPYPGVSAEYELSSLPWDLYACDMRDSNLCRSITFKAKNPDAFFNEVDLLGYRNGELALSVRFAKEQAEEMKKFMTQTGLQSFLKHMPGISELFDNKNDMQEMWQILIDHNQFPQEHIALISDLIKEGNWHYVTPLKPHESLPPQSANYGDVSPGNIGHLLYLSSKI